MDDDRVVPAAVSGRPDVRQALRDLPREFRTADL
jgi:hypothetical protein